MLQSPPYDPAIDAPIYRRLAWIGVALQVLAIPTVLILNQVGGLPSLAIFLAFSVAFLLAEEALPDIITLVVVAAALVNAAGWAWNLYDSFAWFDEFIHTFSGFSGIAAIAGFAAVRGLLVTRAAGQFVAFAALAGFGLGVLWELVEMVFLELTWRDTIVDLVADTAGAAAGGAFALWAVRRRERRELHPSRTSRKK